MNTREQAIDQVHTLIQNGKNERAHQILNNMPPRGYGKVQVQITYRTDNGNTHTSGASFDEMAGLAAYLDRSFDRDSLISVEFTKSAFGA